MTTADAPGLPPGDDRTVSSRTLLELDATDRAGVELARRRALEIAAGLGLAVPRQAQLAAVLGAVLGEAHAEGASLRIGFELVGDAPPALLVRAIEAGFAERTAGGGRPGGWPDRALELADGAADGADRFDDGARSRGVSLAFALGGGEPGALSPGRVDALVAAVRPGANGTGPEPDAGAGAAREAALLAALAEAEAAVAVREEMLAIVSHDLRNPLGSVVTSAEALEYAELEGEAGEFVGQMSGFILNAARQMETLIDDLLDLASLRSGRLAVRPAPEDALGIVAECARAHASLAANRGVALVHDGTPGLTVSCDRARVLQVLSNLVGNAIKFSDPGGRVALDVGRERGTGGDLARFSVLDTGRGMSAEEVSRMFERHWQGDGGDRRGIGLGLSIVRALVDAHGGRIDVDSEPGTGTCVRVRLPLDGAGTGFAEPAALRTAAPEGSRDGP